MSRVEPDEGSVCGRQSIPAEGPLTISVQHHIETSWSERRGRKSEQIRIGKEGVQYAS